MPWDRTDELMKCGACHRLFESVESKECERCGENDACPHCGACQTKEDNG